MAVNFQIYGGIVQLSGTKVEIEVTNDAIQGESPRALLRATSIDGAVPGGPFEDSKPWIIQEDGSGKAIFDFAEYFDAPTKYDFTFPWGDDIAVKHPLRAFDIDLLAGCSYIDNVEASATYGKKIELWPDESAAVSIRILKGGLSQFIQSQYNEAGTNFYQDFIQGNKFLTNRPNNQTISYLQPLRLWYILPGTEAVQRKLTIAYTTSDGDGAALMHDITLEPDGIYEFILDPAKVGIPLNTVEFSVFMMESFNTVSESRTFKIDQKNYENSTFLFFSNSKSGIDDAWFTGAIKLLTNSEGETGIQALDRDATTRDRSVVVTSKSASRKWSIFPGNRLSVAEMEYLQDLIYSRFVWLVWNGKTIPVNLEDGEFELTNTMRDMIINDELELVFTEGHKNTYF